MKLFSALRTRTISLKPCWSRAAAVKSKSFAVPATSRSRSLLHGSEGQALVETAVSLGVLLMVLTGIFAFGIVFYQDLTLTQAVGSGAQYLQQIRTSTSNPCSDTLTAIKNAAPNLKTANLTLTLTMNGVTPTQTGNSCSGAQTDLIEGQPVTVAATYTCNLPIYKVVFTSSCLLSAQVTEYEY